MEFFFKLPLIDQIISEPYQFIINSFINIDKQFVINFALVVDSHFSIDNNKWFRQLYCIKGRQFNT